MPRCELTGKSPQVKNLVSHSNIKTKSVAMPNVQQKRLFSNVLNEMVSLKLAARTLKAIDHSGGLDRFILNQRDEVLSPRARTIKSRMLRRLKSARTGGTSSKRGPHL